MVSEVLDTIPADLAKLMDNVAVFVEDQDEDDSELLGYYDGMDATERSPTSYSGFLPDRIVVFRLPHCRDATSEREVREEVRATVLHEIAHYFGIGDEELHAMERY